ncbi:MAG: NUDIX hydrolase [Proteobacteria bacterium]|nr:NUDIX hydrolase [Pseudomonadota bacterium]
MSSKILCSVASCALLFATGIAAAAHLPKGYWGPEQVQPILEKAITVRLDPDLSGLQENERVAVNELLAAGELLHSIYLEQQHHQALPAFHRLSLQADSDLRDDLLTLFSLFKGPIASTLENERVAFLPVDETVPGKNVYPWGVKAEEMDAFMQAHPEIELLGTRTVVKRATARNLEHNLAILEKYPLLATLQPGLRERLQALAKSPGERSFYALPYSIEYADRLIQAYTHLRRAATAIRKTDTDFAAYLDNRARDLLSNDYESGDASWVTGSFGRLNAQIGSYETYDDELYGAKSFFSLNVLVKDAERSRGLDKAIAGIQEIENALPYSRHRKVRADIPAGVYNVVADFGQARGTNTATILPNDANHARKYGRTIILRHNILTNEELFRDTKAAWDAAVAGEFADDLTIEAGFQRTLWHEIGHYLGVATDEQGRTLDIALKSYSDLVEEMKADLVSLHAGPALEKSGYYSPDELQSLYADGVRRTLQKVKPRRSQPYQTMQLMQMNWFLENGLLSFDAATGRLHIDYTKYHDVVERLLREVLAIQSAGDAKRAGKFVDRYARWDEDLHGVIAKNLRDASKYRYRLVRYGALGE